MKRVAGRQGVCSRGQSEGRGCPASGVREKSFDEFHLYTLERPTTLRDNETKQVELVRATGIKAQRLYIYDGAKVSSTDITTPSRCVKIPAMVPQSNPKVWVMEEFKNAEVNHLGIPLPKGKLRFYRRDTDGHLEFVGENQIDHTPKDETIRAYTGNAFDVVGERKRTSIHVDSSHNWMEETFEIRVRNHKKEAGKCSSRRTFVSLDELDVDRAVATIPKDGCSDGGVSRHHRTGWPTGSDLHSALFVVGMRRL